jgi:hypothetical protein
MKTWLRGFTHRDGGSDNYHMIVNDLLHDDNELSRQVIDNRVIHHSFPDWILSQSSHHISFLAGLGVFIAFAPKRAELSLIISHDKRTTNNGRFLNLKKM